MNLTSSKPIILRKVALAVFKDKKVLMVRSKKQSEVFYSLGGKVEKGESDIETVTREVMEEVNCNIKPGSIKFLKEFEEEAHGRINTRVNIRLYEGELIGKPTSSSEIAEIQYFDSSIDPKHLSLIAINGIFPFLKKNGYIV